MTFSCNVTGNPVPTISWVRNGSSISTRFNSRISFSAGEKQLTITNLNRTDSGQYRCVANNSLGNDTSHYALLDVQCKYNVPLKSKGYKFECHRPALKESSEDQPVSLTSSSKQSFYATSSMFLLLFVYFLLESCAGKFTSKGFYLYMFKDFSSTSKHGV